MKKLFVLLSLVLSVNAWSFIDPKVGGTVKLAPGLEKKLTTNGVLFVIVKQAGPDTNPGSRTPPVAVLKIANPKFPQAFVVTEKNMMMEGTSMKGPLHVIARYSPVGDAFDRASSFEGYDSKFPSTDVGNKNLNILLNPVSK